MSVIVLVPAAGQGRRMGAAVSKQYLHLADRPVLAHTLALFDSHPLIDAIYVLAPAADCADCRREIVERYGLAKVRAVVPGGAERQESVANGLRACGAAAEDIVLVHDGVRPFFPATLIPAVVETARRVGGCVVGVPVKDTIKTVVDGRIVATPERRLLWQAQTPQAFPFAVLKRAYALAERDGFHGTDDASLVERLGLPVAMLAGDYRNIKLTTPEDLLLARAFCCADEVPA
jgi:2-C-methyl-D-erythritol 4-phosphate cytidylyltransferase